MRKSGELDIEVEGRHEEVQKERESMVDWMSRAETMLAKSKSLQQDNTNGHNKS